MSKGSRPRPSDASTYGSNHDRIFGAVKKPVKKPKK